MAFDRGMTEQSDDALMAAYARGDSRAARLLTARHLPAVLRLSRRMAPLDADDIAQEAMLRLWRQAAHWRSGEARVSTWLWRVTWNLSIDHLRRRRPHLDLDAAPEVADSTPTAEARLIHDAQALALHRALASLPPRQRMAISLKHFEDATQAEIAEAMGLSEEAVESLLARARRGLRQALQKEVAA